jgi:20S proteasome alpha/beta subunit
LNIQFDPFDRKDRYMVWPALAVAVAAGVFWQSSTKVPPTDRYDSELPLSSFGSHGRLFGVDATLTAVDRHSVTSVVSLSCRDGVVTVFTTTRSPYIHSKELLVVDDDHDDDHDSCSSVAPLLLPNMARLDVSATAPWAIAAGTGVDQVLLRAFIQELAERYIVERNSACAMARRLADALQRRTQQPAKGRVLVAAALLMDSNSIWKVDAAGQFWKLQGGAIGKYAPKIEQALLEKAESLDATDTNVDPIERIANLTSTQATALARDSIMSVYRESRDTRTKIDDHVDQDNSSVQLRGFIQNSQGHRELNHDSLTAQ